MPSKRIIILEQSDSNTYRYALWADVPASRQSFYANPNAVSTWIGASGSDNISLQTGAVVERVDSFNVSPGQPLATTLSQLQQLWNSFQNKITNDNPWVRYGSFWDGTSWTNAGVS